MSVTGELIRIARRDDDARHQLALWTDMPEHEFDDSLDAFALEWIRFRFTTDGNSVTVFTVQYETTLAGERVPIVRYDSAHGFAHRDVLDQEGAAVEKVVLGEDVTFAAALSIGQQDIRTNWRTYRAAFFREKP